MVPPDDTPCSTHSTIAPREPVTLVKGVHRWTFSCDAGDEQELLRRVSELASRQDAPFDWFDAALVTHQLNRRLMPGLRRIDGRPADATQPPHPA